MSLSVASRGWRMTPINNSPLYWAVTVSVVDGGERDWRSIRGYYIFTHIRRVNNISVEEILKKYFRRTHVE